MAVVERATMQEVVEEVSEIEAQAGAVLLMVELAVKAEQPSDSALVLLVAAKEYATLGLEPQQMGLEVLQALTLYQVLFQVLLQVLLQVLPQVLCH